MATLALSLAGQVVGGFVGGPIGATIGRALGALAGSSLDNALFGDKPQSAGSDVRLQGSREGAPIPRLYGWGRLSGNIIWATELEQLSSESSGAKGASQQSQPTIAANFAVAFCEGEVARLGRIWADGQLLETSGLTLRFYRGSETQEADSLIEAKQGADAPAYRGLCYIVFERLPLEPFGNRIPNISVELCRLVGALEPMIKSVTVIPGATEFGYDPTPRVRLVGSGVTEAENTHQSAKLSDWTLSIDELQALCPNLENVSLVVAWFGDDLRCGTCTITPKVEAASRTVKGTSWEVAGIARGAAGVVSTHNSGPAYGGTPSDNAVLAAIADLKARGIGVTLYPIILMDIPDGNPLGQPAYPWRGRIACMPASDGTATAATEVAAFTTQYRNFILHYAQLADDAGGVDAILLGSEMRGMTFSRGTANSFPFVDALATLADDVRAVVGPDTLITYGADWSEYSGYQPGGGEIFFHLDPLWASANIDAVGIDNYMPLADWRGSESADAVDWDGPYSLDYLEANTAGGEGFDWYYASDDDRAAGLRTPITDGAYGEPWVWRFKDVRNWWGNAHHDRPGGTRSGSATGWVPEGKPIWFTELGCGAVDNGANQPNVFTDPKSSESAKPYFSSGVPDTLAQRQVLRAALEFWGDGANNPSSAVYGTAMVGRISLWTWDARPFPAFPNDVDVWSDGANYATGHWLNGRAGGLAIDELAAAIASDFGVAQGAGDVAPPFVEGYVIDGPMSARDALTPVLAASGLDIRDTAEGLALVMARTRDATPVTDVAVSDGPMISRRRPDPGEAVGQVALRYADRERGYLGGSVTAIVAGEGQLASFDSGFTLDLTAARVTAERLMAGKTGQRDTIEFTAPPSLLALEAGDPVEIDGCVFEITELRDGVARAIVARAVTPELEITSVGQRPSAGGAPAPDADPVLDVAQLPPALDDLGHTQLALAAFARPWPGVLTVNNDATGASITTLAHTASLGEVTSPPAPAHAYLWDARNALELVLYAGHLSSRDDDEVLAGANRVAVQNDAGDWEVIGFADAELIASQTYRLTRLLRGQMGTDFAIGAISAGNRVVVLDTDVTMLAAPAAWLGTTVDVRSFAGSLDAEGALQELEISLDPALPLSPCHLTATRGAGSNDIALSWVRRSRADSDSWTPDDAPLDYSPEAYRLAIYNGASLVRTIDTSAPSASYTEAEQTADFGSPPSSFAYKVAQKSAVYGPGHWASASFTA